MAVVEVSDADGCRGYGETWANYPPWVLKERAATVTAGVRPLVVGSELDLAEPERDIALLQHTMVRQLWPLGRQWGAPGAVLQAISGADQALWDLAGCALAVPVCELIGGSVRASVPVYASGIGPDDVERQVRSCRDRGITAVKLRVGFRPEVDRANLEAARRSLGDDGELLVDANQAWTLEEALTMATPLIAAGVSYVEEPIADGGVQDWAAFHRKTGLRVAVGENVYGRRAWSSLLASPYVAVLQPDISKQGGITELLWLCRQAKKNGKTVEPHLYGGALAYASTLQVAACCRAIGRVELDIRENPVRDGLMKDPPRIVDGSATVPKGPGLGVSLTSCLDPGEGDESVR